MIDWEVIVREHRPAVWRTVHRLLGNRADADECFQETFAAAIAWVRTARSPVQNWAALLVTLATSKAVDRLRRRVTRTSREISAGEFEGELPDRHLHDRPDARAEQAEMSARLRACLAHLPPKQADAFCLHCLEGYSYREIAEHMDTSVENVGVNIHRARAALKERLAFILPHASETHSTGQAETSRRLPGRKQPRADEVSS